MCRWHSLCPCRYLLRLQTGLKSDNPSQAFKSKSFLLFIYYLKVPGLIFIYRCPQIRASRPFPLDMVHETHSLIIEPYPSTLFQPTKLYGGKGCGHWHIRSTHHLATSSTIFLIDKAMGAHGGELLWGSSALPENGTSVPVKKPVAVQHKLNALIFSPGCTNR
jgi:hypothetical protein